MRKIRIFLSYTNREEEVKALKPLINQYREQLLDWASKNNIEVFYDDFSIEKRSYSESEMRELLSEAIANSDLMTAFVSNGYVSSRWCQFEWLESRKNMYPPLHGIEWKRITFDLSWVGLFADSLEPDKRTDVSGEYIEPTIDTLKKVAMICVENSKELICQKYGLPKHMLV